MERAEPLQGGTSTEGRVLGLRVTDCCRRTLQFYWEQLLLGIREEPRGSEEESVLRASRRLQEESVEATAGKQLLAAVTRDEQPWHR